MKQKPFRPKWTLTTREKLWSLVKVGGPDECWEWQGSRTWFGHGRLVYRRQRWLAHRFAYAFGHRKSVKNWVLHHCDNPPCCNPNHLYDGTPEENSRDCVVRGRNKGAGRRRAVTVDQAQAVWARIKDGEKAVLIAKELGVTKTTLNRNLRKCKIEGAIDAPLHPTPFVVCRNKVTSERAVIYKEMHQSGMTYAAIGLLERISGERVRQIMKKVGYSAKVKRECKI